MFIVVNCNFYKYKGKIPACFTVNNGTPTFARGTDHGQNENMITGILFLKNLNMTKNTLCNNLYRLRFFGKIKNLKSEPIKQESSSAQLWNMEFWA